MSSISELTAKINQQYSKMSKGQKLLANYITDYYDKAAFYTANKLGKVVGVSESTVVRFAMFLGYKGYPEFQEALADMVTNRLNDAEPKDLTFGRIEKNNVLDSVLTADAEKITDTINNIDRVAFDNAVESLLKAKKIYVVGIRSCAPLASYLAFNLKMIFEDVILIESNNASEMFEQMLYINSEDAIIGISFPRYSMRTIKAMEFANDRNAKVITITDSVHSPMNLYSSCNLLAKSDMASVIESLVAPMSVINALLVSLINKRQDIVARNLELLEKTWDDYQIYGTDEIDEIDDSIHMHYPAGDSYE